MKTTLTLFVAGMLSASVLSPSLATAAPAPIMTDVGGTVHIRQRVPCGDPVDFAAGITAGRMEITPQVTRDGVFFDLTRLDMFLTPFAVERNCRGIGAVADFSEIGVRLAGAVRFRGQAIRSKGPRVYRFVIPKKSFLIFESGGRQPAGRPAARNGIPATQEERHRGDRAGGHRPRDRHQARGAPGHRPDAAALPGGVRRSSLHHRRGRRRDPNGERRCSRSRRERGGLPGALNREQGKIRDAAPGTIRVLRGGCKVSGRTRPVRRGSRRR